MGEGSALRNTISVEPQSEKSEEKLHRAQGDHEVHAHLVFDCVLRNRAAGLK